MAKQPIKPQQRSGSSALKSKKASGPVWNFPLEKKDLIIIGIGIGCILLGYALMATGITEQPAVPDGKWNNSLAIVVAPILLVIGYCVIIPLGILKFFTRKKAASAESAEIV